jgi:hypothetical protein
VDALSRTVTAGDLALTAGNIELEMMANVSYNMCTYAKLLLTGIADQA